MSLKQFLPAASPGWPDIPLWDKNTIARAAGTRALDGTLSLNGQDR